MRPDFLTVDDVLMIHSDQLAAYGGSEGVRDMGLLDSAVAQPSATFGGEYVHEDIYAMAAAYLFHLVKNHAFIDGNKRTGFVVAITFLDANHMDGAWTAGDGANDDGEAYQLTIAVAEGRMRKGQVADWFRERAQSA